MMLDPVSMLYFCFVLNSLELPAGRLNVADMMEMRENVVIVNSINEQISLREGL